MKKNVHKFILKLNIFVINSNDILLLWVNYMIFIWKLNSRFPSDLILTFETDQKYICYSLSDNWFPGFLGRMHCEIIVYFSCIFVINRVIVIEWIFILYKIRIQQRHLFNYLCLLFYLYLIYEYFFIHV